MKKLYLNNNLGEILDKIKRTITMYTKEDDEILIYSSNGGNQVELSISTDEEMVRKKYDFLCKIKKSNFDAITQSLLSHENALEIKYILRSINDDWSDIKESFRKLTGNKFSKTPYVVTNEIFSIYLDGEIIFK